MKTKTTEDKETIKIEMEFYKGRQKEKNENRLGRINEGL